MRGTETTRLPLDGLTAKRVEISAEAPAATICIAGSRPSASERQGSSAEIAVKLGLRLGCRRPIARPETGRKVATVMPCRPVLAKPAVVANAVVLAH